MKILKIFIGILLFIISIGYLYRPSMIIKFNSWGRKYILNDQLLITHRRKIGTVLLFLAVIALYMGFTAN